MILPFLKRIILVVSVTFLSCTHTDQLKKFDIALVNIPAGSFKMGSQSSTPAEKPISTVSINAFRMGKTEVTVAQYQRCILAGACRPLEAVKGYAKNLPVVGVSWNDIQIYLRWLNDKTGLDFRLPTEAEWEYAARAGAITAYSWGDEIIGLEQANCAGCGRSPHSNGLVPVGSFKPNALGLYDMHGNVSEWIQDCYASYQSSPPSAASLAFPNCTKRIYRGGSWIDSGAGLTSSFRNFSLTTATSQYLGFRLALGKTTTRSLSSDTAAFQTVKPLPGLDSCTPEESDLAFYIKAEKNKIFAVYGVLGHTYSNNKKEISGMVIKDCQTNTEWHSVCMDLPFSFCLPYNAIVEKNGTELSISYLMELPDKESNWKINHTEPVLKRNIAYKNGEFVTQAWSPLYHQSAVSDDQFNAVLHDYKQLISEAKIASEPKHILRLREKLLPKFISKIFVGAMAGREDALEIFSSIPTTLSGTEGVYAHYFHNHYGLYLFYQDVTSGNQEALKQYQWY